MNLDLSSLNNLFKLAAPVFLLVGIVEMMPTGIDLPVSASHLLLAGIGCYLAGK